jgi:DNA-binding CsgD family transcriptional regulator/tetratricopeptide (TPR) repeat protein
LILLIFKVSPPSEVHVGAGNYPYVPPWDHDSREGQPIDPAPPLEQGGLRVDRPMPHPYHTLMRDTPRLRLATAREVFVGRAEELGVLKRVWKDAVSGRGSVVAVSGEPGIGKTRLLDFFADSASANPIVLKGVYVDGEEAPPFLGWQEAIRSLVSVFPSAKLRAILDADAPVIGELVQEVTRKIGRRRQPPALENGGSGQFRLYQAIAGTLTRVAAHRPLLLLLDDIQWADTSSLSLLCFLARVLRDSRVLVVTAYRESRLGETHPLRRTLGELARMPSYQRIALSGFSVSEVGEYVRAATGRAHKPSLVAALVRKTGGNPFLVIELSRMPRDRAESSSPAMPPKIQDVIHLWVEALSRRARDTLVMAAILGQNFAIDAVRTCLGSTLRAVIQDLSEALAAGLLVERPGKRKNWGFAHALVRQSMLAALPKSRRAELHAHAAERLELFYDGSTARHALELAHHLRLASNLKGVHDYIHYAILAGDQAIAMHAYESAEETFAQALVTLPDSRFEGETAEILFGLGRARAALNQPEQAIEALSQAFGHFVNAGQVDRAIAAAEHPFLASFRRPGAALLCRRGLQLTPAESHSAGKLQCQLGLALAQEERNYADARLADAAALRLARRYGDKLLEAQALLLGAYIDREELLLPQSLSKCRRALSVSAKSADPLRTTVAHYLAQEALIGAGDFEEGRKHAALCLSAAELVRDRVWLGLAYASSQRCQLARGDWDAARRFNDLGLELDPSNPFLLAHRIRFEAERGDIQTYEIFLGRFLDGLKRNHSADLRAQQLQHASLAVVLPIVHRVTGDSRLLEAAEPAARQVLAFPFSTPEWRLRATSCLGLTAAARGEAKLAAECYQRLMGIAYRESIPVLVFCRGSLTFLQWQLATLARCAGDHDTAVEHYRASIRDALRASHDPELAWIRRDLGSLLHERANPDTREEAVALLRSALDSARRLGLGPLAVSSEALLENAAGAGSPIAFLTRRETEVLRLVARGRTNKEIATDLFIAERTAGNHVSNLLAKIGCGNRVEAAAFAHQNGLVTRRAPDAGGIARP